MTDHDLVTDLLDARRRIREVHADLLEHRRTGERGRLTGALHRALTELDRAVHVLRRGAGWDAHDT
jgi:hypothetical protein